MTDDMLELNDIMPFGKYKGWTVRDMLADDASYCRWLVASVNSVNFNCDFMDALDNEALRQELINECY